jgi:hypothetical protein
MWPFVMPSGTIFENPEAKKYPDICGGDVTVRVKAIDEPYFGGSSAMLELYNECSRCKFPYYDKMFELERGIHSLDGLDITELLGE